MSHEPDEFDLDAAWLRRSQGDQQAFMEALAVRLEGALPGRVRIERRKDSLFSKVAHVCKIVVQGDKAVYELTLGKATLAASRAKLVRGVTISNTTIEPAAWLADVRSEVQSLAARAGDASQSLQDFL